MHFALPTRKTSARPPAYAVKPRRGGGSGSTGSGGSGVGAALQSLRRSRPATALLALLGVAALLALLLRAGGGSGSARSGVKGSGRAKGGSDIVLVTTFDAEADSAVSEGVRRNREEYARRHGYLTFLVPAQNYSMQHGPLSWSKVPAMRHAMTKFPQSTFFFYLDQHVLIRNYDIAVERHILDRSRLESLMVPNVPIVPPESVIKTFKNLRGDLIDLIVTQDSEGLSTHSFIVRRGEWAKFFLDAWFDPLYRTYNFQRAERHALEHIVQWHGTILAKLAIVPQKIMNSYHDKIAAKAAQDGGYSAGDFILNFGDCNLSGRSCESEMRPFFES